MNREEKNEYDDFLKDVLDGKVHGLGIGSSNTSEQLAAQYLMRGYGTYNPDPIDKHLIPTLKEIVVKPFGLPKESEEFGLEWGVDVVFKNECNDPKHPCKGTEHFEFFFRCTGHGGSV